MHLRRMCILLPLDGMFCIYISVKFVLYNMSFKADVSLLIFCLDDLPIDVSGVVKSVLFSCCCLVLPLDLIIFALYI